MALHSVENRKNLSRVFFFFSKILKAFRKNNAVMKFFSKMGLEIVQFHISAQIRAKMALVKVKAELDSYNYVKKGFLHVRYFCIFP